MSPSNNKICCMFVSHTHLEHHRRRERNRRERWCSQGRSRGAVGPLIAGGRLHSRGVAPVSSLSVRPTCGKKKHTAVTLSSRTSSTSKRGEQTLCFLRLFQSETPLKSAFRKPCEDSGWLLRDAHLTPIRSTHTGINNQQQLQSFPPIPCREWAPSGSLVSIEPWPGATSCLWR